MSRDFKDKRECWPKCPGGEVSADESFHDCFTGTEIWDHKIIGRDTETGDPGTRAALHLVRRSVRLAMNAAPDMNAKRKTYANGAKLKVTCATNTDATRKRE